MQKAAFVDRDGTIIVDEGYLADAARVRLVPGAAEGLTWLRAAGYVVVVVSNQSGIARGLIGARDHAAVHARTLELLAREGITVAASYYCKHGPDDGCACRKPRPGLLQQAAAEHGIDLAASVMIGDKESDVAAGVAAGCRAAILFSGDWTAAIRAIHAAPAW